MLNRRRFISSIAGVFAVAAARLRRAPKVSPVQCASCGSVRHQIPLGPWGAGQSVVFGGHRQGGKSALAEEYMKCLQSQGVRVVRWQRC